MRREKVETISSHAAPSPARHRLTNSAPSLVAKTFAAPTCLCLRSRRFRSSTPACPARWKTPLHSADYDGLEAKVPENITTKPDAGHAPQPPARPPLRLSAFLRPVAENFRLFPAPPI